MEEKQREASHKIQLTDRAAGTITGVKDVISFDDKEISLITTAGMLSIKGENLHIIRLNLDKQEADIEGKTDSLIYSPEGVLKAKGGEGMLKRLFK